jgi:hypothetical protein
MQTTTAASSADARTASQAAPAAIAIRVAVTTLGMVTS